MQRGDVYRYAPVTARPQPTLRIVVAAQALLDAGMSVVTALPIVEEDDPESLLAPRIGEFGWALATHIERTLASRLGDPLGSATPDEIQSLDVALRASLDL